MVQTRLYNDPRLTAMNYGRVTLRVAPQCRADNRAPHEKHAARARQ